MSVTIRMVPFLCCCCFEYCCDSGLAGRIKKKKYEKTKCKYVEMRIVGFEKNSGKNFIHDDYDDVIREQTTNKQTPKP